MRRHSRDPCQIYTKTPKYLETRTPRRPNTPRHHSKHPKRTKTPLTPPHPLQVTEAARAPLAAAVQRVLQTVEPRRLDSWSLQPQLLSLALREARAINAGGQLEPEPVG